MSINDIQKLLLVNFDNIYAIENDDFKTNLKTNLDNEISSYIKQFLMVENNNIQLKAACKNIPDLFKLIEPYINDYKNKTIKADRYNILASNLSQYAIPIIKKKIEVFKKPLINLKTFLEQNGYAYLFDIDKVDNKLELCNILLLLE